MVIALCIAVALGIAYYRLARSNMDIPENAEKALTGLARLRFCLDNDIPIK